jgi:hypothetical protein
MEMKRTMVTTDELFLITTTTTTTAAKLQSIPTPL